MLADRVDRRPLAEDAADPRDRDRLWVAYGVLRGDMVIVVANSLSLLLLCNLLIFKVRETMTGGRRHEPA